MTHVPATEQSVKPEHTCFPVWLAEIQEARERGYFTEDQKTRAMAWNCCAIGEAFGNGPYGETPDLSVDLPDTAYDHPERTRLLDHGLDFNSAVRHDDFDGALSILREIHTIVDGRKPEW